MSDEDDRSINAPFEDIASEAPYVFDNYDRANMVSRLLFLYAHPLLKRGYDKFFKYKAPLTLNDCFMLPEGEDVGQAMESFRKEIKQQRTSHHGKLDLLRALRRCFSGDLLSGFCMRVMSDTCVFCSPIILRLIVNFLKAPDDPTWQGFVWVILLMICNLLYAVLQSAQMSCNYRFAQNARNVLMTSVFDKAMELSSIVNAGEVLQLHSGDCGKFEAQMYLHTVWAAPILVVAFVIQLWFYVGVAGFIGFFVTAATIPFQSKLSQQLIRYQSIVTKRTTSRVNTTAETLNGIKICKFMGWEGIMNQRIDGKRCREMESLCLTNKIRLQFSSMMLAVPTLVVYVVFGMALWLQGALESQDVFPALAVLSAMRNPLMSFPQALGRVIDTRNSVLRIQSFLSIPVAPQQVKRSQLTVDDDDAVEMSNASIAYGSKIVLKRIDVTIPVGSLTMVLGGTGSGKSTLIYGILGECGTSIPQGSVHFRGKVSYSSQEPWLMNATVRENILMNNPYIPNRYEEVIRVCQLISDMDQLTYGDETMIIEKGANLSGGQRQRINLARCVYAFADVYIFDDPLSAVDPHVAHNLIHQCFLGFLKTKTRILVTHQSQFMGFANQVLHISEQSGLITVSQNFVVQQSESQEENTPGPSPTGMTFSKPKPSDVNNNTGNNDKEMEIGNVKFDVYSFYLRSMRRPTVAALLLAFTLFQLSKQLSDLWISWWPEKYFKLSDADYFIWWAITIGGCCILIFARHDIVNTSQLISSQTMHRNLIGKLLHAPMAFFDVTPMGKIVNLFTRDMGVVDYDLPESLMALLNSLFNVLGSIGLICAALPYFSIAVVVFAIVYYKLYQYYVVTTRALKRVEAQQRAPVISFMAECVSGLGTIRIGEYQTWMSMHHMKKLDNAARPVYSTLLCSRWLSSRLEYMGTSIVLLTALLCIIQKIATSDVNVSVLSLSIVYALSVTQGLSSLTRYAGDVESYMTCIERIKTLCETIPQEPNAEYSNHDNPSPNSEWPSNGKVEFLQTSLRYREGLALALKDVTCVIPHGSRVGVVGRTGSGKSTVLLALTRIVELAQGGIKLDERLIHTLKMEDLRSKINVIPQDPILFEGTVLSNLDPFRRKKDVEIWNALKKVQMDTLVRSCDGCLHAPVQERGSNFSLGQRQLLCMARALLKNSKILLMDEATASLDAETDKLIQTTIRSEFHDCTIFTIAHRLQTIMDYDLIMVMHKGELVEFGSPAQLLKNKQDFHSMVWADGDELGHWLTDIANGLMDPLGVHVEQQDELVSPPPLHNEETSMDFDATIVPTPRDTKKSATFTYLVDQL
eukprot:PhF_6_TR39706/c0_g1_i1/m.59050/K05666/ABCC2; ATP-binding cassette, subfamily C (CFTR/MRP), member 2